jgi:hypothetical protein
MQNPALVANITFILFQTKRCCHSTALIRDAYAVGLNQERRQAPFIKRVYFNTIAEELKLPECCIK